MDERDGKNIKIKMYVYEALVDRKHGNDTFSDVIERLIKHGDRNVREKEN
jgi:predicted CopG family antitoxin